MACVYSTNLQSDSFTYDEELSGIGKEEEATGSAVVNGTERGVSESCEKEWENRSDGSSDLDIDGIEEEEEEELYDSSSIPKLQFRNDMWRARWREDVSMAEVLKNKGKIATTTGVIREGKLFCSIEETLYLSERGALSLLSPDDTVSLKDLYKRISGEACGCSWELFEAYRHLKSLGYIVGRHGAVWTMKSTKSLNLSSAHEAVFAENRSLNEGLELDFSVLALDEHALSGELNPHFDVYFPNSKFKKSSPGNPSFKLHVCRGRPPSKHGIEILESKCEGIPLKICHVDHGRVSYLSFNEAKLPELP